MELKEGLYATEISLNTIESITWSWKLLPHYFNLKDSFTFSTNASTISLKQESITWSWKGNTVEQPVGFLGAPESITWSWKSSSIELAVSMAYA